jgi:hypothetical protein
VDATFIGEMMRPSLTLELDLADPWRPLFHSFTELNTEITRLAREYSRLLARLKLWRWYGVDPDGS